MAIEQEVKTVPTLTLTDQQVIELATQLPEERQDELFKILLKRQREKWQQLSIIGQESVRKAAAQRGKIWDTMTEDEREEFILDIIDEDRVCR